MSSNTKTSTEDDPVKPGIEEVTRVLRQSERIWYSAVPDTIERSELPGACFEPTAILKNVPAIPDGTLPDQAGQLKKSVVDDQLTACGFSSWTITGCQQCGLGGTLKDTEYCPITLGVRETVLFRAHNNENWPRRGIITAMTLGLAYIFSKRLVELQGQGDGNALRPGNVHYTDNIAEVFQGEAEQSFTSCSEILIGEVDDEACRWWQALLATGQGWRAEVAADNKGGFLAPWAVQLEDKFTLLAKFSRNTSKQQRVSPPSSIRAVEFLRDFCVLHHAQSEFAISMAIALFLPTNNLYGLPVNLQWQLINNSRFQGSENNDNQFESLWDSLAHYLLICCHPRGMISNLCGAFWEPGIPSNLAHAWLHPPCKQLSDIPGISSSVNLYHKALLRVCVARRPNIGSLFLGATLTGIIPLVLHFVRSGLPVLDLDAAAWVDCEQSFIQNNGPQEPASPDCMLRTDVWRLLFITGEYPNPPLTPWAPFGEMELQNISLQVLPHKECSDHYLSYRLWKWKLADGSVREDKGLRINKPARLSTFDTSNQQTQFSSGPFSIENSASENATRSIFQWVTVNGDGFPPSERDIYSHEWVNAEEHSSGDSVIDESEPEDNLSSNPSSHLNTQEWLMNL